MNMIEVVEYKKQNEKLLYLYIAHNNFMSFPMDILKFKNLKYLSLENNKISDIPTELFKKSDQDLKISLLNNRIKNKEIFNNN
jgi:Leucine-rich repeat (LRR) protein